MSARDEILARVRRNQPEARPLPVVPMFDEGLPASIDAFKSGVLRMGGKFVDAAADGDLDAQIRKLFPDAKVICSATPEVKGNRTLDRRILPQHLDDVDVGVVRARFGVAETGSVWLSESEFKVNALGFLAQHLVVLLDPEAILANMHHAYQHRGFFEAEYAVFMTGPSATADIEGVLIHGAQGIRTLTVIPVPLSRRGAA
jgi:L-lactate dehydrogenase complex protein LldG